MILVFLTILIYQISFIDAYACPNQCSGHGVCSASGCTCYNGYRSGDCSERECPRDNAWVDSATATDTAHAANTECSGMGLCDRKTGICKCREGFAGMACEKMYCEGARCSRNGRCLSLRQAASEQNDYSLMQTQIYNVWDADKAYGCVCDRGFSGVHCEKRNCPSGDDPLTTGQVDEVQELYCACPDTCSGTFRLSFRGVTTDDISYDANAATIEAELEKLETINDVTVTLEFSSPKVCTNLGSSTAITFLTEHGDLPALRMMRNSLTTTSTTAITFSIGTKEDNISSVTGTKENVECSGRGLCESTGICTCDPGFSNSDMKGSAGDVGNCAYQDGSVTLTSCAMGKPTPSTYAECSGHGTCSGSPNYTCQCNDGYSGYSCFDRLCPLGVAWWDEPTGTNTAHNLAECSNRGECDRAIGVCSCEDNFEGRACERLKCKCNGRGRCRSLSQLAVAAGYTYGADAANSLTWDADKLRGCECDSGEYTFTSPYPGNVSDWTGYDCSQRTCPYGNPTTNKGASPEIQTVTCTDDVGSSSVTTALITATPDGTSVEEILEAITSIGDVIVKFTGSGAATACNSTGQTIEITFFSELGDVAELTSTTSDSTVTTSHDTTTAGATQKVECANGGTCDTSRGICNCFKNHVSSDGNNGIGYLGDCGHFDANFSGKNSGGSTAPKYT
eukprot:GSMAST32.ASY1.ANO1.423.1 assembled CDS